MLSIMSGKAGKGGRCSRHDAGRARRTYTELPGRLRLLLLRAAADPVRLDGRGAP